MFNGRVAEQYGACNLKIKSRQRPAIYLYCSDQCNRKYKLNVPLDYNLQPFYVNGSFKVRLYSNAANESSATRTTTTIAVTVSAPKTFVNTKIVPSKKINKTNKALELNMAMCMIEAVEAAFDDVF